METQVEKKCEQCGNTEFLEDTVDLMGDNVEEHFGKQVVYCANPECGKVLEYKD